MIATVKFISCPYNYSSRVFPVGNLDEFVVHTTEAKVTKDLGFSFTVPTFEDYHTVNMVEIDGSYYWVVSYNTRTLDNPTTTFTVAYNPVTSLLKANDTLKGIFERVPYTIDPDVSFSVKDDILIKRRDALFDDIRLPNGNKVAFVQVTSRRDERADDNSKLTKYITFCDVEGSGFRIPTSTYYTGSVTPARFANLNDIINGLDDICGLTADSIIDVSVSMRSPYPTVTHPDKGFGIENVWNENGGIIYPSHPGPTSENPIVIMYDSNFSEFPEKPPYTVSLTLSEQERHLGYLSIVDEGFNKIAVVPKELCDGSGKIEVSVEAVSDYTGLYTHVYFGDTQLVMPEGKLPWVGDAWAEYQKRNMEYDRQALELTIQTARDQRMVDTAENAANSIINGGIAAAINPLAAVASVASFFVGAGADALQEQIDIRSATEELRISQARIKDSPSSYFNTGYGTGYITNSLKSGGACLRLEMPKNTTNAEYTQYVQNYGVPVSGFREVNVQTGFVKGRLTETNHSGPRGDMLNTELINGLKMVVL